MKIQLKSFIIHVVLAFRSMLSEVFHLTVQKFQSIFAGSSMVKFIFQQSFHYLSPFLQNRAPKSTISKRLLLLNLHTVSFISPCKKYFIKFEKILAYKLENVVIYQPSRHTTSFQRAMSHDVVPTLKRRRVSSGKTTKLIH